MKDFHDEYQERGGGVRKSLERKRGESEDMLHFSAAVTSAVALLFLRMLPL